MPLKKKKKKERKKERKKENWQLENMSCYLRTMATLCLEMKAYINKYI